MVVTDTITLDNYQIIRDRLREGLYTGAYSGIKVQPIENKVEQLYIESEEYKNMERSHRQSAEELIADLHAMAEENAN